MKTGIIKQVSAYGFKVEGDVNWHNFNKAQTQVFSENCKKHTGKQIEWEENENGYVTRVGLPSKKPEPPKPMLSLRMKSFFNQSIKALEDNVNDFGKEKAIKYSQTHIQGNNYVCFVWY
jgi:hypothetical protein